MRAAYSPLNRRVWEKDESKGENTWIYNPGYTTLKSVRSGGESYSSEVYAVGAPIYMVSISRITSTPTLLLSAESGTPSGNFGFGEVPHDNTAAPLDDGVTVLLLLVLAVAFGRGYLMKGKG